MHTDIQQYNISQSSSDRSICDLLSREIELAFPDAENKVWHGHPVWFLDGNPIVGYGKLKDCIRLLFWSGQSFETPGLENEGKHKAAKVRYSSPEHVDIIQLSKWLSESREIQWDYKNIVRNKGKLERLK